MKVIIAGSRHITDEDYFNRVMLSTIIEWSITIRPSKIEIVSGGCRGVDTMAEKFANKCELKFTKFPADWNKYGKKAGYIRNQQMADYASIDGGALVVIWDGKSRGSKMMIDIAERKKLAVIKFVYK